ncbi:MAG: peptide chain release factor N(5)-glutamine methyltransferase [Chloroflexota bacterium]
MIVGRLLSDIAERLRGLSDTPELDAQVLLAHILNKPRTRLLAHLETRLTDAQIDSTEKALLQLTMGTPLPYVLGRWEFFGREFIVTPDVLIPRPETELLVEHAIAWLQQHPARRRAIDIGTGSGCIAVSLAVEVRDLRVLATDLSLPALKVARQNARKHRVVKRMDLVRCDLLPSHTNPLPTESQFDLICANLPYIPTKTLHGLPIYGREPTLALDGGRDGLTLVRHLLKLAPRWLAPGGMILLEIEAGEGLKTLSLVYDHFDRARISLHRDLSGKDRLIKIEL